jgi:hypothetical protein
MPRAVVLLVAVLLAACSRGEADAGPGRRGGAPRDATTTAEPAAPGAALALGGEALAARLGSFDWTAAVEWSVTKNGDEAARVHAAEHHRVRQLASGEFEVSAELDPGLGPGSTTGKQVIWANGMTFARALPAPFRERPTDRGRDARRLRDESLGLAGSVAALYGPSLRFEPAGEATVLGRAARRYRIAFARPDAPPSPAPVAATAPAPDPDSALRRGFLTSATPVSAEGELLADARTGAPLKIRLTAAFAPHGTPGVRATVELLAQVKTVGAGVEAVGTPTGALPDERKPAGPSTALEAAGLKKRGEKPAQDEPTDEPE